MGRVFVTGDVHAPIDIYKLNRLFFPLGDALTKEDILIICGDAGFVWDGSTHDKYWIDWISHQPWTTLYVDGNHENFNLLYSYPVVTKYDAKMHQITESLYHVMRGEIMTLNNKSFFCFGGAFSHDANRRVENRSWWQDELPTVEERAYAIEKLEAVNNKVDYIITHDVPVSIHNCFGYREASMHRYSSEHVNIMHFFEDLLKVVDYTKWFAGHYHEDEYFSYDKVQILYCSIYEILDDGTLVRVDVPDAAKVFEVGLDVIKEEAVEKELYMSSRKIGKYEDFGYGITLIKVDEFIGSLDDEDNYEKNYLMWKYKQYKVVEATESCFYEKSDN